jgi:hypothetical protein
MEWEFTDPNGVARKTSTIHIPSVGGRASGPIYKQTVRSMSDPKFLTERDWNDMNSTHLPLKCTGTTTADETNLTTILDTYRATPSPCTPRYWRK